MLNAFLRLFLGSIAGVACARMPAKTNYIEDPLRYREDAMKKR